MLFRGLSSDLAPHSSEYDRFPVNFVLFCPELRQKQTPEALQCNSQEFFEQRDDTWFWNTFAKPVPDAQCMQRFSPQVGSSRKLAPLECLPNELIEGILDCCLGLEASGNSDYTSAFGATHVALDSVLALGLSSNQLWPKVLARIHRDYQHALPTRWAGQKVGYHGKYSCFTNPQIEHYAIDDPALNNHRRYRDQWRNWNWSCVNTQPDLAWRRRFDCANTSFKSFSEDNRVKIKQDLSQMHLFPQDRIWLLRNLATRQMVRSDRLSPPTSAIPMWSPPQRTGSALKVAMKVLKGLTSTPAKTKGTDHNRPLTLAQVFLALSSYSNTRYFSDAHHQLAFQQGPWVGSSFDVVTMEEHMAETRLNAADQHSGTVEHELPRWHDVSEAVAADLGNLRWCLWQYNVLRWSKGKKREVSPEFWSMVGAVRPAYRRWADPCRTDVSGFWPQRGTRGGDPWLRTLD